MGLPSIDSEDTSPIFHLAIASDWQASADSGDFYQWSTRYKTLDEVGYIHCSFDHQVKQVAHSFYSDIFDQVVVLQINRETVRGALHIESLNGSAEKFPHIYGPLPLDAVMSVEPLHDWIERTTITHTLRSGSGPD